MTSSVFLLVYSTTAQNKRRNCHDIFPHLIWSSKYGWHSGKETKCVLRFTSKYVRVCVPCARAYVSVGDCVCVYVCYNGQFEVGLTSMSTDPAECNDFTILSACSSNDYIGILTLPIYNGARSHLGWRETERGRGGGERWHKKKKKIIWRRSSLYSWCHA